MDLIANNLANVNTVGFKVDEILLEERPLQSPSRFGLAPSHVRTLSRWTDFSQGHIQNTGQPLDLALESEGFFVVQTSQGIRLTRDGRFSLDDDGRLLLRGMPVLGYGGQIDLRPGPIKIRDDGRIYQGEEEVAQLRVVGVYSPGMLMRVGDGLFRVPNDEENLVDLTEPGVRQGHLELSNANSVRLMVQMIDVVRSFEMHQRLIQTLDRLSDRAIQGLGRMA
jgi:flagellar basal body rod protein FlgG